MQRLLVALSLIALLVAAPAVVASPDDPPPGYGECTWNEDSPAWVENHDGTLWVVVDPHWRPLECAW